MTTSTLGLDCVGDSCSRWGGLVIQMIGESGLSDTAAAAAVGVARQRIGGHAKQCASFHAELVAARDRRWNMRRALPNRVRAGAVIDLLAGGMTISDAAQAVGVSRSAVYNWRRASASFDAGCRRAVAIGRVKRGGR